MHSTKIVTMYRMHIVSTNIVYCVAHVQKVKSSIEIRILGKSPIHNSFGAHMRSRAYSFALMATPIFSTNPDRVIFQKNFRIKNWFPDKVRAGQRFILHRYYC